MTHVVSGQSLFSIISQTVPVWLFIVSGKSMFSNVRKPKIWEKYWFFYNTVDVWLCSDSCGCHHAVQTSIITLRRTSAEAAGHCDTSSNGCPTTGNSSTEYNIYLPPPVTTVVRSASTTPFSIWNLCLQSCVFFKHTEMPLLSWRPSSRD